MKIAILGYGKEGKAAEKYFAAKGDEVKIYDNFTTEQLKEADFSEFDLVLRSPSVKPIGNWSSVTEYFFENCPCPIIGVTGTKGKGTTCSFIQSILEALGQRAYLVGNIGVPAIEILDDLKPLDAVVYEMSSFQLWDLQCSPHIAVVLGIEPDHLNVHDDFEDYMNAKANIVRFQDEEDYCVYNAKNEVATEIAGISLGETVGYPEEKVDKKTSLVSRDEEGDLKLFATTETPTKLAEVLDYIMIPGQHNRDNAEAAVKAVAAFLDLDVEEFLERYFYAVAEGIADFSGLPHRLEFLKEKNGVKYYDDNFSTNPASTRVAVEAFPGESVVLIAGGRDKTDFEDLDEVFETLTAENVKNVVLIGESGREIMRRVGAGEFEMTEEMREEILRGRFILAESLEDAVKMAADSGEEIAKTAGSAVVLMSPAAASFDMFENVYDRGDKFKKLIFKN